MKRLRRKKGSSLILVVFITAVVFTVATTMVAVVTNDYKTRVNESKKLQNLYQSDAQLDVVYNVIAKNCEAATQYANNVCIYKYNNENVKSESALNSKFKEEFYKFLVENPGFDLKDAIQASQYMVPKSNTATVEQLKDMTSYELATLKVDTGSLNQNGTINVSCKENKPNKSITVDVSSTFTSVNTNATTGDEINGKLKNTKTITTKYTILAPDYNMNLIKTGSKNVATKRYAVEKAITADGNLNLEGTNSNKATLTVKGKDSGNETSADIWIKGNTKAATEDYSVQNDKYAGGIILNNGDLNVTGNVYTNGSLSLSNNSSSVISKDLYSVNAYLGPIKYADNGRDTGNNALKADNIYTNNDLVMNSNASSITANNYIGMSNCKEDGSNSNVKASIDDKYNVAQNSSSIIVNANKDINGNSLDYTSSIEINKATVAGFAYMNTKGNSYYQTGESVAVKGNYKAYAEVLGSEKKENLVKYEVEEYDPWELIEYAKESKDPTYIAKANHFEQYFNVNHIGELENGGIKINELLSTGAAAIKSDDGKAKEHATNEQLMQIIDDQNDAQTGYGKFVYAMNDLENFSGLTNDDGLKCYNGVNSGTMSMKTVAHGDNTAIDFNVLSNNLQTYGTDKLYEVVKASGTDIYNNYDGYCILNDDETKTVTIEKTSSGISVSVGEKSIPKLDQDELNAVLITKGDVILKGDLTINGTIIAGGNVTVSAGSNVKVIHDTNAISSIVAAKDNYFSNLITGNPISNLPDIIVPVGVTVNGSGVSNSDAGLKGWYDADKYLKKGLWKLKGETGEVID